MVLLDNKDVIFVAWRSFKVSNPLLRFNQKLELKTQLSKHHAADKNLQAISRGSSNETQIAATLNPIRNTR